MANTLEHMDPINIQNDNLPLYMERLRQFLATNNITDGKKMFAALLTVVRTGGMNCCTVW